MKAIRWCLIPLALLLFIAGCTVTDEKPPRKGCTDVDGGELRICGVRINGENCDVLHPGDEYDEEIRCPSDKELDCNYPENNSGNVCRVTLNNGVQCVAVLPDGGKSPKDYKDFTTCPEVQRG